MSLPAHLERELNEAHGVTNLGPKVAFVDWALKDEAASKQAGMPKYKDVVFIEKRPRDGIGRDVFRRALEENDKDEFPREWAEYQNRKQSLNTNAPKIGLLPGMTRARFEEFTELKITTCAELVAYKGDLQELERFRSLAQRIMEACHVESREIPEARQELGAPVLGQLHGPAGGLRTDSGAGGRFQHGGTPISTFDAAQDFVKKEKGPQETFRYAFG